MKPPCQPSEPLLSAPPRRRFGARAALAQLVEHRIRNAGVTGSSPVGGTTPFQPFGKARDQVNSLRSTATVTFVTGALPLCTYLDQIGSTCYSRVMPLELRLLIRSHIGSPHRMEAVPAALGSRRSEAAAPRIPPSTLRRKLMRRNGHTRLRMVKRPIPSLKSAAQRLDNRTAAIVAARDERIEADPRAASADAAWQEAEYERRAPSGSALSEHSANRPSCDPTYRALSSTCSET